MEAKPVTPAKRREGRPAKLIYRGVELQRMPIPTRFTAAQIRQAVEDAIAENADAIAAIR